jgi:hypothetical protein
MTVGECIVLGLFAAPFIGVYLFAAWLASKGEDYDFLFDPKDRKSIGDNANE